MLKIQQKVNTLATRDVKHTTRNRIQVMFPFHAAEINKHEPVQSITTCLLEDSITPYISVPQVVLLLEGFKVDLTLNKMCLMYRVIG
jgi:hypothetical protein